MTLNCWKFKEWKSKGWMVRAIALASFAARRAATPQRAFDPLHSAGELGKNSLTRLIRRLQQTRSLG